jgi:hypothetical protein
METQNFRATDILNSQYSIRFRLWFSGFTNAIPYHLADALNQRLPFVNIRLSERLVGFEFKSQILGHLNKVGIVLVALRVQRLHQQVFLQVPSTTGLSLNVFLHSNHRNMPNIIIESEESNDLIAYILSLKQK